MTVPYRLGIDVGTNSLGWCAIHLNQHGLPAGILDIGVRLMTPDTIAAGRNSKGSSLAADRRLARQQRRRRDRYLGRRAALMGSLVRHGLMPADENERKRLHTDCKKTGYKAPDPYELRARGLNERLDPYHFGRAIFHLSQRRGFKSSRKSVVTDEDAGLIDSAITDLKNAMAKAKAETVGQYLQERHRLHQSVRVRLQGSGKDTHYEFYPQRALLELEFDTLWKAQAEFYPDLLNERARSNLKDIIFYQRKLKPVIPGRCMLDPAERRVPKALPLAQRFRIYQELANLRIAHFGESQCLTRDQRDLLFSKIERKPKLSFKQIRAALKLDSLHRFNLETPNRDHLKGDETGIRLAKDGLFGKAWWQLAPERQNEIVEAILTTDDDEILVEIGRREWGLADANARAVSRVALVEGYASIGPTAMGKIVDIIVDQGLDYYHAAKAAGYEPSDFRGDGSLDALPYYGGILDRQVIGDSGNPADSEEKRFGRFPNPTVHVALNQIRALVNALIELHGKPTEIVIELARELKQNKKQKDAYNKRIGEETAHNAHIAEKMAVLGVENTALNRKIYKLWEELGPPEDRRCIYTDQQIPAAKIFSSECAIDHILPFSQTLDDGMENLLLCAASANRAKTNLTPWQWKGATAEWQAILLRADKLPLKKLRRFHPDAMKWWLREEADFVARQLTDTQWIARAAKQYLGGICHADRVWASPGRLTYLLRGKWGLNAILQDVRRGTRTNDSEAGDNEPVSGVAKNRNDHRHHAIDAFVIALTERGILNRVARAAAQSGPERIIDNMPPPWPGFRIDELRDRVSALVVSLKPDHGKQGQLHEAKSYGLIKRPEDWEGRNVVFRKSFSDLKEKEIGRIRDLDLRKQVQDHVAAAKSSEPLSGVALKSILQSFRDRSGRTPRRIRLARNESPLIPIRDRHNGEIYKALVPGENWCIDIFAQPDGSWTGTRVTVFEANNPGTLDEKRKGHPTARRIMRVHKGDYLKLRNGSGDAIYRVVRLNAENNRFFLAPHFEAGELQKRHDDRSDPFRWLLASYSTLKERSARKISIDVLGRVRDPGPPA